MYVPAPRLLPLAGATGQKTRATVAVVVVVDVVVDDGRGTIEGSLWPLDGGDRWVTG